MATEDIGHFGQDLLRSSSFLCLVDPQRLNPRDSGKLRGPWCAPLLGRAASGSARGDDDSCRGASRCLVGQAHKTAGRVPPAVTRCLKIRAAPRRTHPPALNKPEMPGGWGRQSVVPTCHLVINIPNCLRVEEVNPEQKGRLPRPYPPRARRWLVGCPPARPPSSRVGRRASPRSGHRPAPPPRRRGGARDRSAVAGGPLYRSR